MTAANPDRQAALAERRKTYQSDPCMRCKGTTRRTSDRACVICKREAGRRLAQLHPERQAEYDRRWYIKNIEQIRSTRKQKNRDQYVKNREKRIAASKAWAKKNRDQHNARNKRWSAANRDKVRAKYLRYKENNPDKMKEQARRWRVENIAKARAAILRWHRNNPDKVKDIRNRRRIRNLTSTPSWLKAAGQVPLIRAVYAEARKAGLHVDHDIPLAGCRVCGAVGLHLAANLQTIDPVTNYSKGDRCMACYLPPSDVKNVATSTTAA